MTQSCHCNPQTVIDNRETSLHSCAPVKLYLQKPGGRWDLAEGLQFPTPVVTNYTAIFVLAVRKLRPNFAVCFQHGPHCLQAVHHSIHVIFPLCQCPWPPFKYSVYCLHLKPPHEFIFEIRFI